MRLALVPLRGWLPWLAAAASLLVATSAVLLYENAHTIRAGHLPPHYQLLQPAPEVQARGGQHPAAGSASPAQTDDKNVQKSFITARAGAIQQNRRAAREQVVPSAPQSAAAREMAKSSAAQQMASPVVQQAEGSNSAARISDHPAAPGPERANAPEAGAIEQDGRAAREQALPSAPQSAAAREMAKVERCVVFGTRTECTRTQYENSSARAWRINPSGQLEHRSFGDSAWQTVATAGQSRLHVVSVSGAELWAGGEQLQLEHSADYGTTWQTIALPVKNGRDHAILHIHFRDAQHGTVKTDDGISWKTSDGGRSWR